MGDGHQLCGFRWPVLAHQEPGELCGDLGDHVAFALVRVECKRIAQQLLPQMQVTSQYRHVACPVLHLCQGAACPNPLSEDEEGPIDMAACRIEVAPHGVEISEG